jgi:carbon-monoxide dehydrogenase small subunit
MTKRLITLSVNGTPRELAVEPHWSLLETVRERLRLTGSKEGCGTGDCGACSMLVDGKLVTSCLMLAPEADGSEIVTIEGLAPAVAAGHAEDWQLHPVQQAFLDAGGVQCGFCTPGMIVATKALLDRNPRPSLEDVRLGLAGNLCRCTGYTKIYEAVLAAAERIG